MNRKRITSCLFAILLAAVTIGALAADAHASSRALANAQSGANYAKAGTIGEKYEVVYAKLDPEGAVTAVYIVNRFVVSEAGTLVDYGHYDSVRNLTDTGELTQQEDAITFSSDKGDFYYQGNIEAASLPWDFGFSYRLDGRNTHQADIAGATGRLEIEISSRQNKKADPTFYDNYMLQITVTLDAAKCRNLDAPGAVLAEAGKDKAITYTVMPGKDADFTLSADVSDFSMDGIQITGVPYSMDVDFPDIEEKFDDLDKLPEAIAELHDGVGELLDGTEDMRSGAAKLVDGSTDIKKGLSLLKDNSTQIVSGSAQIGSALAQIAAALSSGAAGVDISQMEQLPAGLAQLSAGLRDISAGLTQLKDGFTPAYAALDAAIQGIPAPSVSEGQMAALYGAVAATGDPDLLATLNALIANYAAAQTVKGTYAQVQPAFGAVSSTIGAITPNLDGMADALDGVAAQAGGALTQLGGLAQLGQLAAGLQELSKNYTAFHAGLVSYMDGVDELAKGYGSFHDGLSKFGKGVGDLNTGVAEMQDGTKTLNKEVSGLPDTLREEIEKMKEDYLPADFDAVSFTSKKNTNTVYVQFVMQCGGIEKPEPEKLPPPEPKPQTIWTRLAALFTGGEETRVQPDAKTV